MLLYSGHQFIHYMVLLCMQYKVKLCCLFSGWFSKEANVASSKHRLADFMTQSQRRTGTLWMRRDREWRQTCNSEGWRPRIQEQTIIRKPMPRRVGGICFPDTTASFKSQVTRHIGSYSFTFFIPECILTHGKRSCMPRQKQAYIMEEITQTCVVELASRSGAHSGTSNWLPLNAQYLWWQWSAYVFTCHQSPFHLSDALV